MLSKEIKGLNVTIESRHWGGAADKNQDTFSNIEYEIYYDEGGRNNDMWELRFGNKFVDRYTKSFSVSILEDYKDIVDDIDKQEKIIIITVGSGALATAAGAYLSGFTFGQSLTAAGIATGTAVAIEFVHLFDLIDDADYLFHRKD